jgi:hypothetical protein
MSGTGGSQRIRHGTRQELTAEFNRQGLWPQIDERPTADPPGGRAQIVKHH